MPANCVLCGAVCEMRCARCKAVWYCCAEHQQRDWPSHKVDCKKLAAYTQERDAALGNDAPLFQIRANMPMSYYSGANAALELAQALQYDATDSPDANQAAEHTDKSVAALLGLPRIIAVVEEQRRAVHERLQQTTATPTTVQMSSSALHNNPLQCFLANQRQCARDILAAAPVANSGDSADRIQQALQKAQAAVRDTPALDHISQCESLNSGAPAGYYCGFYDATMLCVYRLLQTDVAQFANVQSTAALATLVAAAMVAKDRLQETQQIVAVMTQEAKQKTSDAKKT